MWDPKERRVREQQMCPSVCSFIEWWKRLWDGCFLKNRKRRRRNTALRDRGEVEYKAAETQTEQRPRYSDARNSVATSTHVLSTNVRNSETRVRLAKLRWITRIRTCTVSRCRGNIRRAKINGNRILRNSSFIRELFLGLRKIKIEKFIKNSTVWCDRSLFLDTAVGRKAKPRLIVWYYKKLLYQSDFTQVCLALAIKFNNKSTIRDFI